jgi:hypothetical protein
MATVMVLLVVSKTNILNPYLEMNHANAEPPVPVDPAPEYPEYPDTPEPEYPEIPLNPEYPDVPTAPDKVIDQLLKDAVPTT